MHCEGKLKLRSHNTSYCLLQVVIKAGLTVYDEVTFFQLTWPLGHVSYCHHFSSVVRPSTFHILIFSSETTEPIATKLWWNGPWMAPFQNCVRCSRLPTKMAAKLKIEKRGDEILIVHCCHNISQNELKFKLQLHGKEQFNIYSEFFCEIFLSADLYRLCKLGIF